jgi:hypothetical protein
MEDSSLEMKGLTKREHLYSEYCVKNYYGEIMGKFHSLLTKNALKTSKVKKKA